MADDYNLSDEEIDYELFHRRAPRAAFWLGLAPTHPDIEAMRVNPYFAPAMAAQPVPAYPGPYPGPAYGHPPLLPPDPANLAPHASAPGQHYRQQAHVRPPHPQVRAAAAPGTFSLLQWHTCYVLIYILQLTSLTSR